MVTYGQRKLREQRRARKTAQQPPESSEQGTYVPPDRDRCEKQDTRGFFFHDTATVRISGFTWRQAGRLVDFYFQIEHRLSKLHQWHTDTTIDCAHGHLHMHRYKGEQKGTAEHLMRLDDISNLNSALSVAIDYTQSRVEQLQAEEHDEEGQL